MPIAVVPVGVIDGLEVIDASTYNPLSMQLMGGYGELTIRLLITAPKFEQ